MNRVMAPAKLTVSLAVTGVRADGYHELRAEMVALSLADELIFADGGTGLTVDAEPGTRAEGLDGGEGNLITRALVLAGRRAAVRVVKRIPVGGGLGGGSSDAAAVLRWAGCADAGVALVLGADVPFSVAGGRAMVEGIGETVTPLEFEAREFLLAVPPFGVDTAAVYAAWDRLAQDGDPGSGENALTGAALLVEPRLARWRDAFGDLCGREPQLAGSGSTWFVEGGPPAAGTDQLPWLDLEGERARLHRTHTVPSGWNGG